MRFPSNHETLRANLFACSCVVPANADFATQRFLNLVSSEIIDNSRVVGVFTKVDRLEDHEARSVSDLFEIYSISDSC